MAAGKAKTPDDEVSIELPSWRAEGPLGRILGGFAESVSSGPSYSFLIFAWAEVLDSLLRLRAATAPEGSLLSGTVQLTIEGYGSMLLTVPEQEGEGAKPPSCVRCESGDGKEGSATEAAITVTSMQAMRLLFGPMNPSATVSLPAKVAASLNSWCPLPVYWAKQDGC